MYDVNIAGISVSDLVNLITNINNFLPILTYAIVIIAIASLFVIVYVIYEFVRSKQWSTYLYFF